MPRLPALVAVVSLTAMLGACTDFATPSELAKPTILAVIADPPITPPGASSDLELVVVGADGRIEAPTASWLLVETLPGVPPMGTLSTGVDGRVSYTAPRSPPPATPDNPPIDSIQVEVAGDRGPLTALKAALIVDVPSSNPTIATVTIDGADARTAATVTAGQDATLAVTIDPPAGDDATYAWYTTRGEIEDYQSAKATLIAPDAGPGWLFVVVRDGVGGVAWHGAPLAVQ